MIKFRNVNIFTLLIAVAGISCAARLIDLATLPSRVIAAENADKPAGFAPIQAATPQEVAAAPAEPPAAAAKTDSAAADDAKPGEAAPASAAVPVLTDENFSDSEVEVLQNLSRRRAELDKREQQISQREALLKAASGEVDRKIAEMNKLRKELEDLLASQKTAEDERVNSLVKIYEGMKPKEAANIFNTLDMDVLLPVISKMSERKSGPILAAMDPEKAKAVTVKLAEQRRLPQLPDEKQTKPAPAKKP